MTTVALDQAAKQVLALIEEAARGEVVRIVNADGAVWRMFREEPPRRGLVGIFRGQIHMSDDFDEPLDDFKDYM